MMVVASAMSTIYGSGHQWTMVVVKSDTHHEQNSRRGGSFWASWGIAWRYVVLQCVRVDSGPGDLIVAMCYAPVQSQGSSISDFGVCTML